MIKYWPNTANLLYIPCIVLLNFLSHKKDHTVRKYILQGVCIQSKYFEHSSIFYPNKQLSLFQTRFAAPDGPHLSQYFMHQ